MYAIFKVLTVVTSKVMVLWHVMLCTQSHRDLQMVHGSLVNCRCRQ